MRSSTQHVSSGKSASWPRGDVDGPRTESQGTVLPNIIDPILFVHIGLICSVVLLCCTFPFPCLPKRHVTHAFCQVLYRLASAGMRRQDSYGTEICQRAVLAHAAMGDSQSTPAMQKMKVSAAQPHIIETPATRTWRTPLNTVRMQVKLAKRIDVLKAKAPLREGGKPRCLRVYPWAALVGDEHRIDAAPRAIDCVGGTQSSVVELPHSHFKTTRRCLANPLHRHSICVVHSTFAFLFLLSCRIRCVNVVNCC